MPEERLQKLERDMERMAVFIQRGEAMMDRCENAFGHVDPKTGKDRLERIIDLEDDYRFFRRASAIGHRLVVYSGIGLGAVLVAFWRELLAIWGSIPK